jgi:hypothetical protein
MMTTQAGIHEDAFGQRLARIESFMEHAATREDLLNLKAWILLSAIGPIAGGAMLAIAVVQSFVR